MLVKTAEAYPILGTFFKRLTINLGTFSITGVHGATDAVDDAWLVNDTNPIVVFTASSGATAYDIFIRNNADSATVCQALNQTSTTVSVGGCSLSNTTSYRIKITAKAGAQTLAATNNSFVFTVDNTTPTANSISGITGTTDSTADVWLAPGLYPTMNWNAFTNAATYDVHIRDSAGSSTVCAIQNTAAVTYAFSSCALTSGTDYRAYVTAKSPSGYNTVVASNNGYLFSVDNATPGAFSITGITGGTDAVVDAYLANGDDPSVNYGTSTNAYRYDVVIKDAAGTTTVCSALNETGSPSAVSCSLTNGVTYRAYVTAKTVSGFNTLASSNDGYSFTVGSPGASPPGNFNITGATGGTDTTADSWLMSGTNVTANWNAASGATSYDVTIRDSADSADVCATQNTTSTSYNFSSCTLSVGTTYLIKVVAKNSLTKNALNNGFAFTVLAAGLGDFLITGATGGTDSDADPYLMNGVNVTANWQASANATSYDVTIRNAADSATVCATQNTTSTSYNFSSCTLVAGTNYLIRVVAKLSAQTKAATNSAYPFYLPNTVNFCPTGSTNATALIIYDSGGAAGNYSNGESCTFTVIPDIAPAQIILKFTSFASNDNNDKLNVYDGSSTGGTNLGESKNTTTPPADKLAVSGSMHMTWVTGGAAASNAAGYNMSYRALYFMSGSPFNVTGITGGSDSTADAYLRDNSSGVTVTWGASSAATSYDVVIRNSANSYDICTLVNTTSTTYNFSSCTLMLGGTYVAVVTAKDAYGNVLAASNSPFPFTYTNLPDGFTISGINGSTDSLVDGYLETDLQARVNWNSSSSHTSYDVTIYENDGYTVKCATTNVSAATSSYLFSGCNLTLNSYYKAEVIAKNANGSTIASNNLYTFRVISALWQGTSLTSVPTGRYLHTAVWTGSEMIIWGGKTSSSVYANSGSKYNPTTDSWSATSTGTDVPTARAGHQAIWTGSEMLIWGGRGAIGLLASGRKYNPSSNAWSKMVDGGLSATSGYSVVLAGSYLIVWGGDRSPGGAKYNISGNTWSSTSMDSTVARGRDGHGAVWTGSEMIVWGGTDADSFYIAQGRKYNPTTDSWATMASASEPSARSGPSMIWTGTEVLVWGGSNAGGTLNTGGKYNVSSNTWSAMTTTNAPTARTSYTAVWTGLEMIIWGGSVSGTVTNTGARYEPSGNTWVATLADVTAPVARSNHTVVWDTTNSQMIVWGGNDAMFTGLNTGGRYDPASDTWSAMSSGANVPSARYYHSAVWTGSEMIIWGGNVGSSGGKYSPITDTWSTMASGGPFSFSQFAGWTGSEMIVWVSPTTAGGKYNPTSNTWTNMALPKTELKPRENFAGVWTGTEMIAWGGWSGRTDGSAGTYLNTGGEYNPTTDVWTETTTSGAPTGRYSMTSVWTGTEMIAWGGWTGSAVNTGGKYNPTSNSWTSTSTGANVPAGRYYNTAVWTGTEMIIWGGTNNSVVLNSGAKYNPTSNSWATVSTGANVPSARMNQTATWTGTKMVVWGGRDWSSVVTNTGAYYDPVTDTWASTPTSSAPTGRYGHSAVWTDNQILIWGGYDGATYLNTGGAMYSD